MSLKNQIIVVGGGLSGLSAAHTIIEQGGNVLLLDKNPFFGYVNLSMHIDHGARDSHLLVLL